MKDREKTKKQLLDELAAMRKQIDELKKSETELKQSAESLNETEARYNALFDRSLFCVYIHDFGGNFLDVNDAALNLTGYMKEELSHLNFAAFLEEDQLPLAFEVIEEIKKTGCQRNPIAYKVRKKNGDYIWCEVEGCLICKEGKPYAIQGIARDITERKRAEKALQKSEQRYKELADMLPQVVFETDKTGNIIFANRDAFVRFGYSVDDFNKGLNALQMLIRGDRDRAMENIQRVLNGEELGGVEYTAQRKDSSVFPIEIYSAPIIHENEPVGLRGIIIDHSVRKQMEKELKKRIKELEDFYNIAIGRELRMKELKDEIKELKEELEKYKKQ